MVWFVVKGRDNFRKHRHADGGRRKQSKKYVAYLFSWSSVFKTLSKTCVLGFSLFKRMTRTLPWRTLTRYSLMIIASFSKINRLRLSSLYVLPTLLTSFITCNSRFSESTFKIFWRKDEASILPRSKPTPSPKIF